ncbi:twin transmembrane helix small protein [Aliiroseovarius lamellibrachiae]|uniref:twin transmembrane helix small protein n=1 Tax=Aliiroseovarius lamellibrachiae TaxID=1924933 RepID=UPI001BE08657|nr:twin transmembrane helix small protein [Aliiroseovarius lamellibrachiae]MBT2131367.1 twin transmembrane helix small protein [Aliiroseovarius lamellibrachiae]
MFSDPLFVVMILAIAAVLIILLMGIGTFGVGGEFARKNSNRFMRYRVYAQAVAIALILLFIWLRGGN